MEIALQTIEYLGDEMDYVPWTAAEKQLSYVQKMLVRTSLYGKYKVEREKKEKREREIDVKSLQSEFDGSLHCSSHQ